MRARVFAQRRSRPRVMAVAAALCAVAWLPAPAASAGPAAPAAPAAPAQRAAQAAGPCGTLPYDPRLPPTYSHVVVIMDENVSYDQLRSSTLASYLHSLEAACGSEANMHAATHPSQPNYMAATSGIASRVGVHTSADNIFFQLQKAGETWRTYADSMPAACSANGSASATYKAGHNAAVYYTDLRSPTNMCNQDDLPLSPGLDTAIQNDTLPSYTWIVPNLCHDMHWTSACGFPAAQRVGAGDAWLSTLIPRLTAMRSYQAGQTVVLITFDEGVEAATNGVDCTDSAYYPKHPDCQVAAVLVSPYIVRGAVDHSDQNIYSLLGTTEDILGLARLNRAVGQPSMRPGLGF